MIQETPSIVILPGGCRTVSPSTECTLTEPYSEDASSHGKTVKEETPKIMVEKTLEEMISKLNFLLVIVICLFIIVLILTIVSIVM